MGKIEIFLIPFKPNKEALPLPPCFSRTPEGIDLKFYMEKIESTALFIQFFHF